jgi:hypothetical protein
MSDVLFEFIGGGRRSWNILKGGGQAIKAWEPLIYTVQCKTGYRLSKTQCYFNDIVLLSWKVIWTRG